MCGVGDLVEVADLHHSRGADASFGHVHAGHERGEGRAAGAAREVGPRTVGTSVPRTVAITSVAAVLRGKTSAKRPPIAYVCTGLVAPVVGFVSWKYSHAFASASLSGLARKSLIAALPALAPNFVPRQPASSPRSASRLPQAHVLSNSDSSDLPAVSFNLLPVAATVTVLAWGSPVRAGYRVIGCALSNSSMV